MVEKALLLVLVALGIIVAASAIATAFHKMADKVECAFDHSTICILDDAKEQ